ncbi:MAG: biotin--[acetyl-CoA-carboxylase] ligase [Thermodesulfobacteriota bacterium]
MSTAERILRHLRSNPEPWTSGQQLSRELAVSRSAVWKHIRALRREGYEIESSPRKGYRLTAISPRLLPGEIRQGLTARVLGRQEIVFFLETDSTNTRAKALATSGAPEGTLVIAERQTGGRGRKGRTWFSPSGQGVYLSLILRPRISPVHAPRITLIAGIAAAEMLMDNFPGLDVHIKWPNDILVGRKKVAGILTEIAGDMDEVGFVVSGMGLNVNARRFPQDIRTIATSIALETGRPADRAPLVRGFLEAYEQWYDTFLTSGAHPVLDRWKSLSRTLGNRVVVDGPGGRIKGIARDMDQDGSLLVQDDQGTVHPVFSGDVEES